MFEHYYRVGDVVRLRRNRCWGDAEIVARSRNGSYALEYQYPNKYLHDCSGLTEDHCGYWARQEEMELVETAEQYMMYRKPEKYSLMMSCENGVVHGVYRNDITGETVMHTQVSGGSCQDDVVQVMMAIAQAGKKPKKKWWRIIRG